MRATPFTGPPHTTRVWRRSTRTRRFAYFQSLLFSWITWLGHHHGALKQGTRTSIRAKAVYTPPGWDRWVANFNDYYNYTNDEDGTLVRSTAHPADCTETCSRGRPSDFIAHGACHRPFFLRGAEGGSRSIHPAPRHVDAFAGMQPTRRLDFNEADVSDKPTWVQHLVGMGPELIRQQDLDRQHQFESLLAADDAVRDIFDAKSLRGAWRARPHRVHLHERQCRGGRPRSASTRSAREPRS